MLTKEYILSKYDKFSDITEIKKLNIYGEDIQDITIISKMPNIEILSLSSNKISSLSPLSICLNMRELYIRNNNINSFRELKHLRPIRNLKVLWLEGNPICKDNFYRDKVLNILPQVKILDNKNRCISKYEKEIKNKKRLKSVQQKKNKYDFDYNANISKSNRKKILLRRVFSYLDSTNDGKIIETSNEISLNNQNKKNNKNFFLNKKNDLSELKLIFHTKGNSDKKDKQFFRKLKLKIKKEENKNNFYLGNNNMFNNYLGNAPRISKKKLTVETNPITNPMPRIKERDSTTVQNSISIEAFKGNMFRNINNDKFTINNNCNNSNYIMKAIYLLVDKMNVNDLISLKDAINQKIAILTKTN
jgi:Leucine-rich repeat (LRR) protein